jgi:uncharacterized membrane protein YqjE
MSWLDAIAALGREVCDGVRERVELAALELHEEKLRLCRTFVWLGAAIALLLLALLLAALAFVVWWGEDGRLAVLIGLALFFGVAGIAALALLRWQLLREAPPLAATREELEEDTACLGSERPRD